MQFYLEIITYGPSINTMDHPDLNVSIVMENLISPQRVNHFLWHRLVSSKSILVYYSLYRTQ